MTCLVILYSIIIILYLLYWLIILYHVRNGPHH